MWLQEPETSYKGQGGESHYQSEPSNRLLGVDLYNKYHRLKNIIPKYEEL